MNLRRRVLVGILVVSAVLVVTNLVLFNTFHSFLLDGVDGRLVDIAGRPVLRGDRGRLPPQQSESLTEYFIAVGDASAGSFSRLESPLDADDRPSPRLEPDAVLAHLARPGQPPVPYTAAAESGDGSWRLAATAAGPRQTRIVVVGVSLDDMESTLGRIRRIQLLAAGAVLLALGAVSWWMLRLGVHPLAAMATTADAIAGGNLSHRVEHTDDRTEAGRLGLALNSMLGRIEEAFRQREESEARVRRFAADASHELRTPLTSIQGYAELWRAGGLRHKKELGEAMRRMEQEARRMGALVEDLLLLARLDQHRPVERVPVQLDEIAADVVRDSKAVEPDRPVDLDAQPVRVDGDESQLRQVVANLLANARVHTPAGTPVRVSVHVVDGMARLEVADEGPGMAPDVATKVFERFYRADPSRARAAGGAGLGLSIVAAVAEAHGGRAAVDTEVGRGSRFTVELPSARP